MIEYSVGSATDTGRLRQANQDSLLVVDNLFAVADGMGGARGGEVASATAVEVLGGIVPTDVAGLIEAIRAANASVFSRSMNDPDLRGMGTTMVAAVGNSAGVDGLLGLANVGDSRAYLLRQGQLSQLSLDHSLVETLVRRGQLSPEAALVHPQRNVILRSLGVDASIEMDAWEVQLEPGDRVTLCSDGLFNEVGPEQIRDTLVTVADPDEAAAELVRLANEGGGRDNITVVIIDASGTMDQPAEGAPFRRILDADRGPGFVVAPIRPAGAASVDSPTAEIPVEAPVADGANTAEVPLVAPPPVPQSVAATPSGDPTPPLDEPRPAAPGTAGESAAVGERSSTSGSVTDAGVSDHDGPPAQDGQSAPEAEASPSDSPRRRSSWLPRLLLFGAIAVALVAAVVVVGIWARSSYVVGATETGEVVIFKGQPSGFLWMDPEIVVGNTGLKVADLSSVEQVNVEAGVESPTLAVAREYLDRLKREAEVTSGSSPTNPTTTTRPTTTTVRPTSSTLRRTTTTRAATTTTVRRAGFAPPLPTADPSR